MFERTLAENLEARAKDFRRQYLARRVKIKLTDKRLRRTRFVIVIADTLLVSSQLFKQRPSTNLG